MSCVPLRASRAACHAFSAKVNTLSVKRTCQRLMLNERKIRRDRIGFQQCLRWAVLDSRGVFSTPRTAPLRGRAQGPPAHGRGRPRPSKAGARTGARRLTKGIVAPRLCPSSRGESSDEKCDAPGLCTEQAQWPLPRCSPPSVWWSTFRPSLENGSRKHCHPAGCPLALAQRHTGSPTGRIRVPCPRFLGTFTPSGGDGV